MKIWFGTTTRKLDEYKEYYYAIRNYLIENGHVVLFDWLDDAMVNMLKHPNENRNIKDIYNDVVKAINECDVSIIEFTVPNFSSSHQINYSLFKRKPTLVMRLFRDNTFTDSYLEAIDSPFLNLKEYTLQNMRDVIDEFIGYSQIESGQGRYNIVLDKRKKHYLDWASVKYKKSKSLIIRELLDEMIAEDADYRKYLKS
jgi:hypothetical protein